MGKKVVRFFLTVVGGLIGLALFMLVKDGLSDVEMAPGRLGLNTAEQIFIGSTFVFIFSSILFRIAPTITRGSRKVAVRIDSNLKGVSSLDVIGSSIGIFIGLGIGYFISLLFTPILRDTTIYFIVSIIIYLVFGSFGALVGRRTIPDILENVYQTYAISRNTQKSKTEVEDNEFEYNPKSKQKNVPKIIDTSAIIDGRILEILRTGFFEGPIIIPEFVLTELRHIADSSDSLKRTKGRRGLDILKRIQEEYGIEIYNTDSEKGLQEIPEVDLKLLKLAQNLKGKVVTNDFNLNKVAQIKGVIVLNINELANAIKTLVVPGDTITVTLIKEGKDRKQAIAYLDDGTMVVCEEGKDKIGKTITCEVTSVIQTQAGRMIFGKVK